jgi:hypothetical protein
VMEMNEKVQEEIVQWKKKGVFARNQNDEES